jgi:hypothetical protein
MAIYFITSQIITLKLYTHSSLLAFGAVKTIRTLRFEPPQSRRCRTKYPARPCRSFVFRPLGYHIPLAIERGYDMHYGVKGNATLGHSERDADGGFTLAPMRKGVRPDDPRRVR